jgi:hypothetical protein
MCTAVITIMFRPTHLLLGQVIRRDAWERMDPHHAAALVPTQPNFVRLLFPTARSFGIWDWTSNTIVGTNDPYGTSTAFNWSEYTAIVGYGTTTQQTIGPSNSTWNSSQGMGMIYTEHTVDPTTYGLIRGGGWSFGNTAGLEALSLNATSGYQQVYDGFRCTR